MEIRVPCLCEQTYAFNVEPVNGTMPCPVNCPACGADGTGIANEIIRQHLANASAMPGTMAIVPPQASSAPSNAPESLVSPAPAAPAGLRINRQAVAAPAPPPPVPVTQAAAPTRFNARPAQRPMAKEGSNGMVLGILGALIGALVGSVTLYVVSETLEFKFPLFGTVTGLLTGLGARILFRGRDSSLGGVSAAIALIATTGTLFLLLGSAGMPYSIISILISASMAWRIAS